MNGGLGRKSGAAPGIIWSFPHTRFAPEPPTGAGPDAVAASAGCIDAGPGHIRILRRGRAAGLGHARLQAAPAQIELAQAIGQAIQDRATLVAEAGTGIGKTWAYLVPAFIQGGKVLISTGTRTLQDQLFSRDLPRAALAAPVTAALLKGRGNYICHYHLDRMQGDERALKSRSEIAQLRQIQVFAGISKTGDRGDLAQIPEDAEIWQRVTSTRENCLGQECPRIRDCFVVKARRQAQDADVVVVNHALFMADLVLREEGVTDLLPEADTVIFDEAHQLPDTATRFLGSSVSTHQLLDFGRALEAAGLAYAREAARWSDVSRHLETAARELRLVCAPLDKLPGRKATFEAMPEAEEFDQALAVLREAVDSATNALGAVAEKHPDLMAAARNGAEISARLKRWATPARAGSQADEDGWGRDDQSAETAAGDGQSTPVALLEAAAAMQWTGPAVRWVEHGLHHVRLHSAPLSVAQAFSKFRKPGQAWIMTSATLSVNGEFEHFTGQLGLDKARTGKWESPFDYPEQGCCSCRAACPSRSRRSSWTVSCRRCCPCWKPVPAARWCCARRCARWTKWPVCWPTPSMTPATNGRCSQGDATRRDLLERFCKLPHPVLVGSASFWEGIDLPGDVLTLVAIDKLPFAPPDDPVIEARLRVARRAAILSPNISCPRPRSRSSRARDA